MGHYPDTSTHNCRTFCTWMVPTNEPSPAPVNGWSSITASIDGTKLAAAPNQGSIWISSDTGESWSLAPGTENDGNGWYSITSSSDGTALFAAAGNHTGLTD